MTPKEKALQLFNNYFEYVEAFTPNQQNDNAKKCALITVDEIIETLKSKQGGKIHNEKGFVDYWQEVKQEISLL
jgi:hypothetical protein